MRVSIRDLCSCKERFQLFFLSFTAPGAQLWFQPHLCMGATHRHLLPKLPWSTRFHPSEERVWRQHGGWGHRNPGGNECMVELAAMGMREPALVGVLPSAQSQM